MYQIIMASDEYGAENFDYDTRQEAIDGYGRLTTAALSSWLVDGIVRTVSTPAEVTDEDDQD